jgi:hypothetical protein
MKDCKKDGTFAIVVLRGRRRKARSQDVGFSCDRHLAEQVRAALPVARGHRVVVSFSPVDDAPCESGVE